MTGATRKLIREGDILPTLTFAGPEGSLQVPGPGGKSAVLVFTHGGSCAECSRYVDELGDSVAELRAWAARLLAVVPEGGDPASEPFPVLVDEGGAARGRLGIADGDAAVVLADRWGEVMEMATFGDEHGFPLPRQLVESAKILDLSCGECNVPGPEWRQQA